MAMATMCLCNFLHHALPHCKFVLYFCEKFPNAGIVIQEANIDTTNTYTTIMFMSKETYHVVNFMAEVHTNNEQHFTCIP